MIDVLFVVVKALQHFLSRASFKKQSVDKSQTGLDLTDTVLRETTFY